MPVGSTVEPETKQTTKVVANPELTSLLKKWADSDKKAASFFADACQYALDKKLSKPTIEASVKAARPDWAESTYRSEISRLWTFVGKKENHVLIADMKAGRKTVTQARSEATKKQLNPASGKKTNEAKLKERVEAAAKFAAINAKELLVDISDVDQEDVDSVNETNEAAVEAFLDHCREAFNAALLEYPIFGAAVPEGATITEGGEGEGEGAGEEEAA